MPPPTGPASAAPEAEPKPSVVEPGRGSSAATLARRAARREALLDNAVDAIRREGPAVSMETIAAEAGVTKPIVYRHFGDRDGLVIAIADRFVTELLERLQAAFARDAPPLDVLTETIDAFVGLIERDTNVYRFLMQQGPFGGQQFLAAVIADQVAHVLRDRLDPDTEPGAAEVWATGMVGLVHFAGDRWAEHPTVSRQQLVHHLTTLLWTGLDRIQAGEQAPLPKP